MKCGTEVRKSVRTIINQYVDSGSFEDGSHTHAARGAY